MIINIKSFLNNFKYLNIDYRTFYSIVTNRELKIFNIRILYHKTKRGHKKDTIITIKYKDKNLLTLSI